MQILLFQKKHRVKMKEISKTDKYSDLARVVTKSWNMEVTEISIVVGAQRTISEGKKIWKNWKSEEESRALIIMQLQ